MCIWLAAGWYWLMYVRFWLYISLQFVERIARNLRAWIVLSYAIRLSFRFVFSDSLSFVFVFFFIQTKLLELFTAQRFNLFAKY